MPIKFTCKCGVTVIAFTKKPGEPMKCNSCGADLVVPDQSESMLTTGVIHRLKPDEIATMKQKAKEERKINLDNDEENN